MVGCHEDGLLSGGKIDVDDVENEVKSPPRDRVVLLYRHMLEGSERRKSVRNRTFLLKLSRLFC